MANEVEIRVTAKNDTEKTFNDVEKRAKSFTEKIKGTFGRKTGEESGEGFGLGFVQKIGPIMAKAPIGAPIIGAVAAAAPIIVSTVSAALTAGVALAGVGAGIAVAVKDPAVKAAASATGAEIGQILRSSAAPFTAEVIKSVGLFRRELRGLEPEFKAIFAQSAEYLPGLSAAAARGVRELAVSFRQANEDAAPVVEVLEEHLPKILDTVGEAMEDFASESENTADTLDTLLTGVEQLIGTLGLMAEASNKILPFVAGPFQALGDAFGDSSDKAEAGTENVEDYAQAVAKAAGEADKLADAVDRLLNRQLDANEAERGFQEAIDSAMGTYDKKVKVLDLSTERGRKYSEALDNIASSAQTSAQAILDNGGSQEKANRKFEEGRAELIRVARHFGLSQQAAEAYVDQLGLIPPRKRTVVDAQTAAAEQNLRDLKSFYDALKSKTFTITAVQKRINAGDYTNNRFIEPYAHGGIKGAATGGLRSGETLVGEHGPEIVDLAPGSHVMSNPDTMRTLANRGGGEAPGAPRAGVLRIEGGGGRLEELLVELIIKNLRLRPDLQTAVRAVMG